MISSAVIVKKNYVKAGLISVGDLFDNIWSPSGYPKELHESLLHLLQSYELVVQCNDLTTTTASSAAAQSDDANEKSADSSELPRQERKLLFPALLPDVKPGMAKMWNAPEQTSLLTEGGTTQAEIERVFTLTWLPDGLFTRFIARAIELCSAYVVWRTGMLVTASNKVDTGLIEINKIQVSLLNNYKLSAQANTIFSKLILFHNRALLRCKHEDQRVKAAFSKL